MISSGPRRAPTIGASPGRDFPARAMKPKRSAKAARRPISFSGKRARDPEKWEPVFGQDRAQKISLFAGALAHLPEAHDTLRGGRGELLEILERGIKHLRRRLGARPRADHLAYRRPAEAGRACQDQYRIGAFAAHQPIDDLDRHRA